MSNRPEQRQLYDTISLLEDTLKTHVYFSELPVEITGSAGDYVGYYCFYGEKALRLEYEGAELTSVSFWDQPDSLTTPSLRLDLSDLDDSQAMEVVINTLLSQPTPEDNEEQIGEVEKFLSYMGSFLRSKGASEVYDSYEPWSEMNDESIKLSRQEFTSTFNKVAKQTDVDLLSRISDPTLGETIKVSEPKHEEFSKQVTHNEDYYTIKMLKSALLAIINDDTDINAMFVCGSEMGSIRPIIKNTFQDAGVWTNKVLWKDRTTSIYQFIHLLWKYRNGYILVFDNVESPVKNKDHNFNMLLDGIMKTQSPNRIVSYSRKERK